MMIRTQLLVMLFALGLGAAGCIAPIEDEGSGTLPAPAEQTVPPDAGTESSAEDALSTPALIEAAYAAGEIDDGERILQLAYAIYEPESLADAYASDSPWRGTMTVQEIKAAAATPAMCEFATEVQAELRRLVQGAYVCDQ